MEVHQESSEHCWHLGHHSLFSQLYLGGIQGLLIEYLQIHISSAIDQDTLVIGRAGKLLRLVRVMRILRVFKLVKHFTGLQVQILFSDWLLLKNTCFWLVDSKQYLLLIGWFSTAESPVHPGSSVQGDISADDSCLCLCPHSLQPSLLLWEGKYFSLIGWHIIILTSDWLTQGGETNWSFYDSFWWGLMCITTVGQGENNPKTTFGKIIGSITALLGVFILALPVPLILDT